MNIALTFELRITSLKFNMDTEHDVLARTFLSITTICGVHVRLWGVHFHCRFSLPESSIDSAVIRHPFHPQLSLKLDGPLTQVVDTLERLEFYLSQKVPIFKLSTIYSHFFGY